ncbi:hypothetical protein [Bartonella phoceensis]|uniref:hypothetical protein n=1 Tax=Bartonella phoceensis TaxID=270249 RepID=UPI001ABA60ED
MIGKLKSFLKYIFDVYVMMIKVLLACTEFDRSDAADALALVLCLRAHHVHDGRADASYHAKIAI